MIRYLGISGKRGAGKDTLCAGLMASRVFGREYVVRIGLADAMKLMLRDEFGVPMSLLFGSDDDKEQLVPGTSCKVRDALKVLGIAYISIRLSFWVDRLCQMAEAVSVSHPSMVVIVPDVRFPHEVNAIHDLGGKVIRLLRTVYGDNHPSETALDSWVGKGVFDAELGDGGIDATREAAEMYLKHWGWGQ